MKRRCIYCHKEIDTDFCPSCKKNNNLNSLSEQEVHELHQFCHKQINKYESVKNSGLTFIVISFILGVVGGIITYLGKKSTPWGGVKWVFNSNEFIIGCILLVIAAFCLIYGIVNLIIGLSNRFKYSSLINKTSIK